MVIINNFEEYISQNGIIILKFFLNLSKDEQKNRLLRRLDKPKHNWKFSPGDLTERKLWDQYAACYEEAIGNTSKKHAPWHIIPADNKEIARYLVAKTILDTLKEYKDIQYPEPSEDFEKNITLYRQELEKDI